MALAASAVIPPMAGGTVAPATNFLAATCRYLKHKCDYVRKLDKNLDTLEKAAKLLYVKEADVQGIIERDEITKEKTHTCKEWLDGVKQTRKKVEGLKSKHRSTNRCLCGLCPFLPLLKLSKQMVKLTEEIQKLDGRMIITENPVVDKKPEPFVSQFPEEIDDLPSVKKQVQILVELLKEKDVKKIGIWGMAGVGKTTIMKILNDTVYETGLFDFVIWVNVEEEDSVRKIQETIVKRLKLSVQDIHSINPIASRISKALEKQKYLLFLDQVSMKIDLEKLGVRDNHKHGKVVLATRCRTVCDSIVVHEWIPVRPMSQDDAWELLRKVAGDVVDLPRIKPVAEKILRQCGGVPQLIKSAVTTLRNEFNSSLWWSKLAKLQLSAEPCEPHDLDDLFSTFRVVYNALDNGKKKCILYGAMFPEDHQIYEDYLMECWIAEQFIQAIETRNVTPFRAARDEGHAILKSLTDASLLERCPREKYVKMPMLYRGFALRLEYPAEEGSMLLVKAGEGIKEHPAVDMWKNARRISLMCNKFETLPESPECCTISTLFLQKNKNLRSIPQSFFAYICGLQVLDLHHTDIESLPSSISNLISLKGLYLNNCSRLLKLPTEIEELQHLEVLDIRHIGIHNLPSEIGKLTCLKCLRVSFNADVDIQNHSKAPANKLIPHGVIKGLSLLEELTIEVDADNPSWNNVANEIAKEVASLESLTTLCFSFPSVECLATFTTNSLPWKNNSFRSFKFLVGSHKTHHTHGLDISEREDERHLKFSNGDSTPEAIALVLKQACTFELIGHTIVRNLSSFGLDSMVGCEVCVIEECNEMLSIVGGDMTAGAAFPVLEKLHILNLLKLRCIWEGSFGAESLAKLTTLTLNGCPMLKKILSCKMTQGLRQLQHLRVQHCSQATVIIDAEEQIGEIAVVHNLSSALPKLKSLVLVDLPELHSICEHDSMVWPALQKIKINSCKMLKNLSLSMENAVQLKSIKCNKDWWSDLNLEDKSRFEHFCHFFPQRMANPTVSPEQALPAFNQQDIKGNESGGKESQSQRRV